MRKTPLFVVIAAAACNNASTPSPGPTPSASSSPTPLVSALPSAIVLASAGAVPTDAEAPATAAFAGDAGDPDLPSLVQYAQLSNEKFAFTADYPTFFIPRSPDGDGRGQTFHWKTKATLRAWAMYALDSITSLYADWVRRPGITFKEQKDDYWIVAGTDGTELYYSRSVLADGLITTLEVHYDAALKDYFAPIQEHVTSSLKMLDGGYRHKWRKAHPPGDSSATPSASP